MGVHGVAPSRARPRSRSARAAWALLTLAGGAAFWVANLLISLTPGAAAYRSAVSIGYGPMLVEAAVGGLLVAGAVAVLLLRFAARLPGAGPVARSLVLAAGALGVVTVLVEVPAKLGAGLDDPGHWLAVATVINGIRLAALGVAIGVAARAQGVGVDRRAPARPKEDA